MYFVGVTAAYLAYQRNWRQLFGVGHLVGLAVLTGIIAAWQVPYYWATDWPSVVATWSGLAGDRITLNGLIPHLLTYPWETLGCLLPWSPLLVLLVKRPIRQAVAGAEPYLAYLTMAIAVTYPTVWFAAHARGRYFMPLYPCFALLIGLAVQACAQSEAASRTRHDWNNFLRGLAVAVGVCGAYILCASCGFPGSSLPFGQPVWLGTAMALAAVAASAVLLWAVACRSLRSSQAAVFATVAFLGLFSTVVLVNHYSARWHDARPQIAQIKLQIPAPHRLVSFGPVDHRFAYFYGDPIQQLPWPMSAEDVPAGVNYFCMNQFATDTPQQCAIGRGRTWTKAPGTLPVNWEPVGTVCCERERTPIPQSVVIVGRIAGPAVQTARVGAAAGAKGADATLHEQPPSMGSH